MVAIVGSMQVAKAEIVSAQMAVSVTVINPSEHTKGLTSPVRQHADTNTSTPIVHNKVTLLDAHKNGPKTQNEFIASDTSFYVRGVISP